jgi:tetratricopeptide (TPR) repeat protein
VFTVAIALVLALAALLGGWSWLGLGSGVLMALIAGGVPYFLILRRARGRAEAAQGQIEADLNAQRFDRAIERLEALRPIARFLPFLGSAVDQQIGAIRHAALSDFAGAEPYLRRARLKTAQTWAMLAAGQFRRGQSDEADATFERGVRRRKKEGLLWAAYAWCAWKRGQRNRSLEILGRARAKLPNDKRIEKLQLAIQNGRPVKMKAFGADWYALHLERAPAEGRPQTNISPDHPALRGARGRVRMRRM